jgi:hypothetical protein
MTKTILAITICSALALPAFANSTRMACVPTTDANGVTVYYPAATKVAHKRHAPKRVARAQRTKRVYREEVKTVAAAPAPVITETYSKPVATPVIVRHERSAEENRRIWLRNHTASGMILGNMSGAAGTSALGIMHGTDNPYGREIYNNDEGPSASNSSGNYNDNRSTAHDNSEDKF